MDWSRGIHYRSRRIDHGRRRISDHGSGRVNNRRRGIDHRGRSVDHRRRRRRRRIDNDRSRHGNKTTPGVMVAAPMAMSAAMSAAGAR